MTAELYSREMLSWNLFQWEFHRKTIFITLCKKKRNSQYFSCRKPVLQSDIFSSIHVIQIANDKIGLTWIKKFLSSYVFSIKQGTLNCSTANSQTWHLSLKAMPPKQSYVKSYWDNNVWDNGVVICWNGDFAASSNTAGIISQSKGHQWYFSLLVIW